MDGIAFRAGDELQFPFVNYRDSRETRHVLVLGASYGANAYYPEPQWFLDCWDLERGERRSFAIAKIDASTVVRLNHDAKGHARGRMTDFQSDVSKWMLECFGEIIAMDPLERIMRFLEEALELAQAEGMTEAEVGRVVSYVFGRPAGESFQEVGGVMVTLAAFCFRRDIDLQAAALTEFDRIDTPEMRRRIFEKQDFKRRQGLTSDGGFREATDV